MKKFVVLAAFAAVIACAVVLGDHLSATLSPSYLPVATAMLAVPAAGLPRDFIAFRQKLESTVVALYERREAPDMTKLAETIDKIGTAFEAHKKAVDEQIAEIKKTGTASPETEAKLKKIGDDLTALGELKTRIEKVETRAARPGAHPLPGEQRQASPAEIEHREAFLEWLRDPRNGQKEAEMDRKAKAARVETRAVDTQTGAAGGYAVPEIIAREIGRIGLDISPIRQIARVVTVGSPDYKEEIDVGGAATGWVGETSTRNETGTSLLSEVAPTFGMIYAYPKASEESLNDIFFNVEQWVIESAADAIAKGEGTAFVSGNGTVKPTGFLAGPAPLATVDGTRAFGTLQYVASGQAAAMPTDAGVLIDMVHALRARYRANAQWVTSKLVLGAMRKYKDSTGQFLWQPSLQAGVPQTFLGYGVTEAEDMPTVAANAFPVAFGDFREGYVIADIHGIRITRDEVTTPGYVKFYVRKRVGGKLRNTEALKLLKIATS